MLFPNLSQRAQIPELMDNPACNEEELLKTVRHFSLLNRLVSRYRPVLSRWILKDMLAQPDRSYRVADLGAGGCDIAVWLLRSSREIGLDVSVLAVESNARIADYARRTHGNTPGLKVTCQDATDLDALGDVDYIIGNHFLHHLADQDIAKLLQRATTMRLRRFVFIDLCRNYRAYYLHSILAALLFPLTFVGPDGRRSIRRGFRLRELTTLLAQANILDRVELHRMIPARVILVGGGTPAAPAS